MASRLGIAINQYSARRDTFDTVARIWKSSELSTNPLECIELFQAVRAVEHIPGEMAEIGVYKGGTAAIMLEASKQKHLHLFDTFSGLPHDAEYLKKGQFAGTAPIVRKRLESYLDRITLYVGLFPQTAAGLDDESQFSFVHLDTDIYEPTIAGLEVFWPRMQSGGIILSHDYPNLTGIVRAFEEFFSGTSTPVIPLSGHNCIVVKP